MNFGLLVSQLPRVHESHAHYDTLLSLQPRESRPLAWLWRSLMKHFA
ncbi:hypothetical protein [Paraburkholderia kururiensis]|uniref:Uncharacterized protein n=1 Tax=Paraburkholderia kururiensis TaxID=984307 RepID=A0ABZ0WNP7_9BURK|nr:hypothetical protein [Paraburkholderia kururiensis]WQD78895.1 hypothetical protein U0042_04070 [Paraburkholderia kururiensis]